jgi:hypothetical protein
MFSTVWALAIIIDLPVCRGVVGATVKQKSANCSVFILFYRNQISVEQWETDS